MVTYSITRGAYVTGAEGTAPTTIVSPPTGGEWIGGTYVVPAQPSPVGVIREETDLPPLTGDTSVPGAPGLTQTPTAAEIKAPKSEVIVTQRGGGLAKAYGGVLTQYRVQIKDMSTGKVTTLGRGHFPTEDQKTIARVVQTGGYLAYYPKTDTYYVIEGGRREAPAQLGAAATPTTTPLPTPTVSIGTGQSIFTGFPQQQRAYSPYGRRPYFSAKERIAEAERTKMTRMAGPPWERSELEQIALATGETIAYLALLPVMLPYSIYQTATRPMETAKGIEETATKAPVYFATSLITGVALGGAFTRAFNIPRTPVVTSRVTGQGSILGRTARGSFMDIQVSLPKILRTAKIGKTSVKQEISSFAKVSIPKEKIPALRAKLYGAPKEFAGDISAIAEGFSIIKETTTTAKRPFFTPWKVKQIVSAKESVTQYPRVFIGEAKVTQPIKWGPSTFELPPDFYKFPSPVPKGRTKATILTERGMLLDQPISGTIQTPYPTKAQLVVTGLSPTKIKTKVGEFGVSDIISPRIRPGAYEPPSIFRQKVSLKAIDDTFARAGIDTTTGGPFYFGKGISQIEQFSGLRSPIKGLQKALRITEQPLTRKPIRFREGYPLEYTGKITPVETMLGFKFVAKGKDFLLTGKSVPTVKGKAYSRLETTLRHKELKPEYKTDLITEMITGGRDTQIPSPRFETGSFEFWQPGEVRIPSKWPKQPYKAPSEKIGGLDYLLEGWADLKYTGDYTARITGKKLPLLKETGKVIVKEKLTLPKQMPKAEQLYLLEHGMDPAKFDYFLWAKGKRPTKPYKSIYGKEDILAIPKEFTKPPRGTAAFEIYAIGKYADYLKDVRAGKIPKKQWGKLPTQIQEIKPTRAQMADWHENFLKDYFGEVSASTSAVQSLSKPLTGDIKVPQPRQEIRSAFGGFLRGGREGGVSRTDFFIQVPKPRGKEDIMHDLNQFVNEGIKVQQKPKTVGGPRLKEFIGVDYAHPPVDIPIEIPETIITPLTTVRLKPKQWYAESMKMKTPPPPRTPTFVFTPFTPAIRPPPLAISLPTPFGGGVRKKVGRPTKTTRVGRRYKPSLIALMFGVTAKKQPVTTGIEIRPIISTELPSLHDLFTQKQVRKYVKKTKKRK
jgi:hypothetical protein